jgi:large subunit ribosomal protein L25
MRVDLKRKLRTSVPLTFHGAAKLASDVQLTRNVLSVEVECLPTDIPDHIEVDESGLINVGDQFTVGDLKVAQGVEIVSDAHEVIARIEAMAALPTEEEAAEGATGEGASEPEVVEKGKKEEEEF